MSLAPVSPRRNEPARSRLVLVPTPTIPNRRTVNDWRDEGNCLDGDPDAFFPAKGGSANDARKVCKGCPEWVREECLDYALANDEQFGTWGGLSTQQRNKLKRRRAGQPDMPTLKRGTRKSERNESIIKAHSDKVSPEDIGKRFDISTNTVYRIVRNNARARMGEMERYTDD